MQFDIWRLLGVRRLVGALASIKRDRKQSADKSAHFKEALTTLER
jgi:hypothetical protein